MPLRVPCGPVAMTDVGHLGLVASVPFSHGLCLKPRPLAAFPALERPDLLSHALDSQGVGGAMRVPKSTPP